LVCHWIFDGLVSVVSVALSRCTVAPLLSDPSSRPFRDREVIDVSRFRRGNYIVPGKRDKHDDNEND